MPNWCQNRLIVSGPREQVERFKTDNAVLEHQAVLSFGAMVPEPPEGDPRRVSSDSCEGGWDWYSWRVDNWGTKWDLASGTDLLEGDELQRMFGDELPENAEHALAYVFDTAWSPPLEWFRRVVPVYRQVYFELAFCEIGNDFSGLVMGSGGEPGDEQQLADEQFKTFGFEDYC